MKTETQNDFANVNLGRRSFLRYAGATTAVAGLVTLQACSKDDDDDMVEDGVTDVGSGDFGVLNYAYALEQLEAAFYIKVASAFPSDFSEYEKKLFTDIKNHEVVHREFFKAALNTKAIKGLTPDFSSIDFTKRATVLATAKVFEDLGVTAYDGIAFKIESEAYLTLAGKIVSVEARHASIIANLISPGSFLDGQVSTDKGLNASNGPTAVLAAANKYLKTKVSAKSFKF